MSDGPIDRVWTVPNVLSIIRLRSEPISPEEGAYLGVEICRALDYAHRRAGIVHRDVTPRNVLVVQPNRASFVAAERDAAPFEVERVNEGVVRRLNEKFEVHAQRAPG